MAAALRSCPSRFSSMPAGSMGRFLRICGVTAGLTVMVVFGFVGVLAAAASAWPPTSRDLTGIGAFFFIAAIGAAVAHLSSPGIFTSSTGLGASAMRTFRGRLQLSQPEGLAFWTFVVCAVLLFVPVIPRVLVVLAGFVSYLIASAVMLTIGPRWWYRLVFTLIASIVIVVGLVSLAETLQPHAVGEGGLAILGPMMFSWAILPAIVLVRVLARAMRAP